MDFGSVSVTFTPSDFLLHEIVARLIADGRKPTRAAVRAEVRSAFSAEGWGVEVDPSTYMGTFEAYPEDDDYLKATLWLEGWSL
jgi:hypothetical protein